jgi:hypothetical protein
VRGLSSSPPGRLADVERAIDAANALDPNQVLVRGERQPLALAHGRLAVQWVRRLVADPDDTLLIAARAHHLRRWEVPRTSYPEGRAGYLRWRRDQKARHARDVAVLLEASGYGSAAIERVQALVRRDGLGHDPGAQAVEDAACLVFLETQLAEIAGRLDHDHLVEVVRRTARKMSQAALALVADVPLDRDAHVLVATALRGDTPTDQG